MSGFEQTPIDLDSLLDACRVGRYAVGLDLGHAKKLILDMTREEWAERWGPAPTHWRPLIAVLLVVPFAGCIAGCVTSFLLLPVWWAVASIPFSAVALLYPGFRGFPHPHPFRFLVYAVMSWWATLGLDRASMPVACFITAMLASHTMYFLAGRWLRAYALRYPKAFEEWLSIGFIRVKE